LARPHWVWLNAWIAHLSYANVAGFATFNGRYVVGEDRTAGVWHGVSDDGAAAGTRSLEWSPTPGRVGRSRAGRRRHGRSERRRR